MFKNDLARSSYVGILACPENGPRFRNKNFLISLPKSILLIACFIE